MTRKIIGVTGLAGAGKDTIGDIMVKNFPNWEKVSFASHLKDVASVLFGFDREMLAGTTIESREKREQPDEFWSKKLGKPFTPRNALQILGTEIMRKNFLDTIWIDCLEKKILESDKNIIITDVRFQNELNAIRNWGGIIWRIEKPEQPDWFSLVEKYRTELDMMDEFMTKVLPELNSVHISEWNWIGFDKPEHKFLKQPTVEMLEKQVIEYVEKGGN